MATTPTTAPQTSGRSGWRSFVAAAVCTAGLLVVMLSTLRHPGPAPEHSGGAVYLATDRAPITAALDGAPAVHVLAGIAPAAGRRERGLEAILRLHLWLAWRDVHPGPLVIDWAPATDGGDRETALAARCLAETLPPGRTLGQADPTLLGEGPQPRRQLRAFIEVASDLGVTRVEARVCPPGSLGRSSVLVANTGEEGPLLRELLAWVTSEALSGDSEAWFAEWGRPPAPSLTMLRAYGDALTESQDPSLSAPPPSLIEAAGTLPEAAWLAAALSPSGPARRQFLQRAAALRPGFTAAIEDLAGALLTEGRPDLAQMTMLRLRSPQRARPSELLLASRALHAGAYEDALLLLTDLPDQFAATTTARRLEALARLGTQDAAGARAAAASWGLADPAATEAFILQGSALLALDEPVAARHAYEQALREPSRLRPTVLARWSELMLRGDGASEVASRLGQPAEEALVLSDPRLLELRAWARWTSGSPAAAIEDLDLLAAAEPDQARHARNRCVVALESGVADSAPSRCGAARFADVQGQLLEAGWLSRRAPRSPEEVARLEEAVRTALAQAPLASEVAAAALRVLGPRAEPEELAVLRARHRVALGVDRLARRQRSERSNAAKAVTVATKPF